MSLVTLDQKLEHLKTAFESIDVLIIEHDEESLKTTSNYLLEQISKVNKEIDVLKNTSQSELIPTDL